MWISILIPYCALMMEMGILSKNNIIAPIWLFAKIYYKNIHVIEYNLPHLRYYQF